MKVTIDQWPSLQIAVTLGRVESYKCNPSDLTQLQGFAVIFFFSHTVIKEYAFALWLDWLTLGSCVSCCLSCCVCWPWLPIFDEEIRDLNLCAVVAERHSQPCNKQISVTGEKVRCTPDILDTPDNIGASHQHVFSSRQLRDHWCEIVSPNSCCMVQK